MNLPSRGTPRLVIFVRADRADRRSHVGRPIMFVIPQQKPGHSNFPRRMAGRLDGQIRRANKSGQGLNADVVTKNGALGSWRNFAHDRRRIANSRRVIERLFEELEMPVVKIGTTAIGGFGWTAVGEHQVAGQRNELFFERIEELPMGAGEVFSAHAFRLGFECREISQERSRVLREKRPASQIDGRTVLETIAFNPIRSLGGSFRVITALPGCEIDFLELAIFRDNRSRPARGRSSGEQHRECAQDNEGTHAVHLVSPCNSRRSRSARGP